MSERVTRILVLDDDVIVARSIAEYLAVEGYETDYATNATEAESMVEDAACGAGAPPHPFGVLVTDLSLPDHSGLDLIKRLKRGFPDLVPIVITGYGTIESAVQAIRQGAIDYLTKPIVDEELRLAVEKAVNQHMLIAENEHLREQLDQRYGLDNIVGNDARMRRIYDVVEAVAVSKTTVLMTGESGTGKSLIARAIHRRSPRGADKPFVELSCGSIPESLLESELFGHMKGAFTGAHIDKPGRFLAAHGGTIFLDEINSASPGMQLKLLRVLQERTFEPVGSHEPVEVDVRVILASNQPLEQLVASGEFRQDLYFRINVVMIQLPALRDRLSDIPQLAEHFLAEKASDVGKQMLGFTGEAMAALRAYAFPGNVRELENIVERAVVLTRATQVGIEDLPTHVLENSSHLLLGAGREGSPAGWDPGEYRPMPLRQALEEPEKQIILAALEANHWNRQQTAEQLDINRTTLYKKIKAYGLERYGQAG